MEESDEMKYADTPRTFLEGGGGGGEGGGKKSLDEEEENFERKRKTMLNGVELLNPHSTQGWGKEITNFCCCRPISQK